MHGENPRRLGEIAPEAVLALVRSPQVPPPGLRVYDDASVAERAGAMRGWCDRMAAPAR